MPDPDFVTPYSDLAQELFLEHEQHTPFTHLAPEYGVACLDDAYRAQDAFVQLLCKQFPTRPVGYKIGLTSMRMQRLVSIDQPVSGVILESRLHYSPTALDPRLYGRLGLEFEIAVQIGQDLKTKDAPFERSAVDAAVRSVCAAVEVIDDRAADYANLDVLSLIADNSWNAGAVLGNSAESWPDLISVVGTAFRNGQPFDSGTGRDVLGHPMEPLLWLANALADRGDGLKIGDVVLTGSIVPTQFVEAGETYRFELGDLSEVQVQVTEDQSAE